MELDQYTADRFSDLNEAITNRFFQTPQRIKVLWGILEISTQTFTSPLPSPLPQLFI